MKTKLLFLATLLAIGGSLFAQGTPVKNLFGSGAPNANLASVVGTTYVDQSTSPATVYTCTAVTLTNLVSQCTWTAPSGGGSSAFSAITGSTNTTAAMVIGSGASLSTTGTGAIGSNATGSYLVAASNYPNLFGINGGGAACNPNGAINPSGGGTKNNDALSGCANIPSGAGVTNGFTDGVAGYVINNNSTAAGQFGKAEGVAVYGACANTANNAKCEGGVFQAADSTGNTGSQILGMEVDVGSAQTTTTGFGIYTQYQGGGQPTGNNFPAYMIQAPTGAGTFTDGYECATGSIAIQAPGGMCLQLGQVATGLSQSSQSIKFNASTSSTATSTTIGLLYDSSGILSFGTKPVALLPVASSGTPAAYSISATSTAALSVNQLVKIDSANADSMVVCTTSDTQCQGFVLGGSGVLCGAGSTVCPIVMSSGQRVQGILGTGTCAIDNPAGTRAFVVADTTTNGRVKCVTSQPAVGAFIGLAISAQVTVGSTVDILTKFQ
jgi:hypothetical protein